MRKISKKGRKEKGKRRKVLVRNFDKKWIVVNHPIFNYITAIPDLPE
jgi:hypothetical protein